jgi:hypothetical protein
MVPRMRLRPIVLAAPLLAGLALSCANPPPPVAPEIPRPAPAPVATAAPGPTAPDLLPAQVLALVDDESATPYFARRSDGGLLFYSSKGRWLTRATGADGKPRAAAAIDVAGLAADVSMASLKPAGDGYLAVWVELVAKNHAVKLLSLDAEGKPRGEPVLVSQVTDDLSWVDVLPNARGALVLWEVPHDDRSDIFVVPTGGGKLEGAPALVAHDVIGWEAEATERGAAIATVAADGAPAVAAPSPRSRLRKPPSRTVQEARSASVTKLGKVFLTEVDSHAKAGAPVAVSAEPTAQLDVTLSEIGGRYVIAWTDERNIDACVYLAAVDVGGRVTTPPHRATAPFGEQALVSLVAEPFAPDAPRSKRGLLAWEDQLRAPREGRLIHLATVGADAQIGKERAGLVFSASGPPDLEPDGEGFAAVTLAPVHDLPPGVVATPQQGVKGDAPVWPAYVRFGADLHVTASEPLRAEAFAATDGVPYLTRMLSCGAGNCSTLGMGAVVPAKGPDSPGTSAPIVLFSLPVRPSPWKAPALRENDEAPPHVASVTALYDGEHLARVAASEVANPDGGSGPRGSLVAWVTYAVDVALGPAGKKKGKREEDGPTAALTVRPIGAGGAPGKPVLISKNAVSEGGVALAAAPAQKGKKPETALAWVARERNEAQVFVTKLGPEGEKLAQKGVTTISRARKGKSPSDAADVAIAYAGGEGSGGDGWITAWVDTRDGNPEIYAAKLDRSLGKAVADQRITNAPGDSVEVQIAVRGKDAFLVWSDARSNPDEGSGDIYLVRLDAATLKRTGPEVRLFASATHSRTPQITPAGKGFVVSWIEEGADPKGAGDPGSEAGLRVALLDERGAVIGAPQLVRGAEGQSTVSAATLGCAAGVCRGVLTSYVAEGSDALTLGAFQLTPGSPAGPVKTIAALTGATQDASPVFASPSAASLFFADDAVGGSGRVRWMQITWP